MQQTKSYWRLALVAGVVSAFVGAACTVTTNSGDGVGDAGEGNIAGSSGAGTAGTAGTGTAGTAGVGEGGAGATPYSCDSGDAGATGTPDANACEMTTGQGDCDKCVRTSCCTEYSACYATDPGNQCGYGGPNNDGEFVFYQSCLLDAIAKNGSLQDSDAETCANSSATSKDLMGSQDCGSVLGTATSELIACVAQNCNTACYGL
ncbi:MAG: hypothetical protein ABI548_03195 [Polyangiaceae bacterium]